MMHRLSQSGVVEAKALPLSWTSGLARHVTEIQDGVKGPVKYVRVAISTGNGEGNDHHSNDAFVDDGYG
jgi:hypothetical protein